MINKTCTIGITGNIATGKSVIRRMLANAGALGMDADVLAHRMYYPGGPAYQTVIQAFGTEILSNQDQISSKKLGEIVFNHPDYLKQLEAIVHPLVEKTILGRIQAAHRSLVALEAIKLLEANLDQHCDYIWVSHAAPHQQVQRLMQSRGFSEGQARLRIESQTSQSNKLARADVIINTEGNFKDTWRRTLTALNDTIQLAENETPLYINSSNNWTTKNVGQIPYSQLEPSWTELSGETPSNLYAQLGSKVLCPLLKEDYIKAFLIWEDWNFSATLVKVYPKTILKEMPGLVLDVLEKQALMGQSEILLIAETLIRESGLVPDQFGFDFIEIDQFTYPAWKMAAVKSTGAEGTRVWTKILSQPFELQSEFMSK